MRARYSVMALAILSFSVFSACSRIEESEDVNVEGTEVSFQVSTEYSRQTRTAFSATLSEKLKSMSELIGKTVI